MTRLFILATLVLTLACGDDDVNGMDTGQDATSDTNGADTNGTDANETDTGSDDAGTDASTDTGTDTPTCTFNGFTAAAQDAFTRFGNRGYIAQSTLASPVDTLNFELLQDGGATENGTYTITDASYGDCVNCVLIYRGCDENLQNCQESFLANAGTLEITNFGASGEMFEGTLSDVRLVAVTIEGNTSMPLAGGATWCIDSFNFSVMVQ